MCSYSQLVSGVSRNDLPNTNLSELLRMASAVASLAGKGRPSTLGAVSKISNIHAFKCLLASGSRLMAELPVPPESTLDGFIEALREANSE